jgi:hypothetical protein
LKKKTEFKSKRGERWVKKIPLLTKVPGPTVPDNQGGDASNCSKTEVSEVKINNKTKDSSIKIEFINTICNVFRGLYLMVNFG